MVAVREANDENKVRLWTGLLLDGKSLGDAFRDIGWRDGAGALQDTQ